MIAKFFDQDSYDLRCEWGIEGARRLASGSHAVIIVDVISFSTTVDIAASRGAWVYPFAWRDERSAEFARSVGAVLAVASRTDPRGLSLAPRSMLRVDPGARIVLPSPNGSALSLETGEVPTFAGCLRNAGAVAFAASRLGRRISVIPAGERWPDGSLRPALEDLLGAGAILHALKSARHAHASPPHLLSPEAEAAVAAFLRFRENLLEVLLATGSGLEAAARGGPEDVQLCADLDASGCVPRLIDGAYRDTR